MDSLARPWPPAKQHLHAQPNSYLVQQTHISKFQSDRMCAAFIVVPAVARIRADPLRTLSGGLRRNSLPGSTVAAYPIDMSATIFWVVQKRETLLRAFPDG